MWSNDGRGALSDTRKYERIGQITAAVFVTKQPKLESWQKRKWNQLSTFYFGTDQGTICQADDMGACVDVEQPLKSEICVMMYYEEKARLVVINKSLMLTQYIIAEDGRVTRGVQVKLSVSQLRAGREVTEQIDVSGRSVVWAGSGLLAISPQEKFVRMLDLSSDDSYTLSLSALGDWVDKRDRAKMVAFDPVKR